MKNQLCRSGNLKVPVLVRFCWLSVLLPCHSRWTTVIKIRSWTERMRTKLIKTAENFQEIKRSFWWKAKWRPLMFLLRPRLFVRGLFFTLRFCLPVLLTLRSAAVWLPWWRCTRFNFYFDLISLCASSFIQSKHQPHIFFKIEAPNC